MINPRIFLIYNYCNLTPPEDVDGIFVNYSQYSGKAQIQAYTYEDPFSPVSPTNDVKDIDLIKLTGILKNFARYEAHIVEENNSFKIYSMDHREVKSMRICMPVCELQVEFIDNTEDYNFEEFCKENIISKWRVV